MRYKLYADKLINMLTSIHIGGRKHILWMQSMVHPLQVANDNLQQYFEDKIIESKITSQVMYFEWYLNKKLSKYFLDSNDKIVIKHFTDYGVPIYKENENEANNSPLVVFGEMEHIPSGLPEKEHPKPLYLKDEAFLAAGTSFDIAIPSLNVENNELEPQLRYIIDRYKIAGKTYKIVYKK